MIVGRDLRLRFVGAWFALALAAGVASAQEAQPIVRARLSPAGPVIVGQPVRVVVDVLVPNYFLAAPQWPDVLDVDDAIASLDETARANFTESVSGTTFAGQTREYVVYAQVPGAVAVPPIEVPVRYALESGQPAEQTLGTSPLSFEARVPDEAADLGYFFATTSFRLTERYEPEPTDVKVGDAVTRTVTMRAVNSSAILLPPVEFDPLDGLAVYPRAPRVADSGGERGTARLNERVDAATYVFERDGAVRLPEISVSWWDSAAGRLRTASLPERTLQVAANPTATPEIALPEEVTPEQGTDAAESTFVDAIRTWWRPLVLALAVLLAAGWVVRRYGSGVVGTLARWRHNRSESEAAFFLRLRRASRGNDPRAVYRAALAWLDRVPIDQQVPSLDALARSIGSDDLARESANLTARLYGRPHEQLVPWSGRALYEAVARARRTILGATDAVGRDGALTDLNPR